MLHRLQVLAAGIRVREQMMQRKAGSRWRPADERLYRPLRQVDGRQGRSGLKGRRAQANDHVTYNKE